MADAGGAGGSHAAAAASEAAPAPNRGVDNWREWDEAATSLLLDLYTDRYLALHRGSLRSKEWQQVVDALNSHCAAGHPVYTYNRCKNKIDSLKKTFKAIREKQLKLNPGAGAETSTSWKWFSRLERIAAKSSPAPPPQFPPETTGKRSRVDVGQLGLMTEDDPLVNDDPLVMRSGYCPPVVQALTAPQQQRQWQGSGGKRQRGSSSSSPTDQQPMNGIAQMMVEALEKMEERRQVFEEKRMEMLRELEKKRTETQWEIAKMIIEASQRTQAGQHQCQRQHSPNAPPSDT